MYKPSIVIETNQSQIGTIRVFVNSGLDLIDAVENNALMSTIQNEGDWRHETGERASDWILQQCLSMADPIGYVFNQTVWPNVLLTALLKDAAPDTVRRILTRCDILAVQYALCFWIRGIDEYVIITHPVQTTMLQTTLNTICILQFIQEKIGDFHFRLRYGMIPRVSAGYSTPASWALGRSRSFSFFVGLLRSLSVCFETFVKKEVEIIGDSWTEETLMAVFLDDSSPGRAIESRRAFCKYCMKNKPITIDQETPWEIKIRRIKAGEDPNGPFSEDEIKELESWNEYVHEFTVNEICGLCQERVKAEREADEEDQFSPFYVHL